MNINETENPRKHGKALSENLKGFWCYEVGNYRIICEIKDRKLVIVAVHIGHRREVYR
ncbi:MAG: type II toxin-antitoxin system RelE/ParE family toxin [Oscillospiraceae bacterium]|nr:type II toxin-antitoxin system RelE/ParE family toxin [Oscillospiraceae bacterium]